MSEYLDQMSEIQPSIMRVSALFNDYPYLQQLSIFYFQNEQEIISLLEERDQLQTLIKELQNESHHNELQENEDNPKYLERVQAQKSSIDSKGKVGLYSKQKLYNGQDGYQYSGNQLIKISENKSQKQNSADITPTSKQDTTPKNKIEITPKNKIASQQNENQFYLVKYVNSGSQLGELSILMDINRTTSAIVNEDQTVLLRLHYSKFMEILRIREESKLFISLGFIKDSSSINFLSFNALKDIFVKSFSVRFQRDQLVCLQNQYPQAAFMIQSGEFSLWSYTNLNSNKAPPENQPYQTTLPKYHIKQEIKMSLLGIKEIFGDIEILSKQNYAYSLKCESEGEILIIPRHVYESKVMQNDLLVDIIKNKSSNINQKRLVLYKKFTQNLEVFRHFMYDADDTDEEDSGKINYNKGYEVFKKSKVYKQIVKHENSPKGNNQQIPKKEKQDNSIERPSFQIQQSNGQQMKELKFLENVNCYELNNQDKKNFYFTYKGSSSHSNKSSIISQNDLLKQDSSDNQQKEKNERKSIGELYKVFQTDCPLSIDQNNPGKNSSRLDRENNYNSNHNSRLLLDDSLNLKSVFHRNNPPRPSSKLSSSNATSRRVGSFSISGEYQNKEFVDFFNKSVNHHHQDQGVKMQESNEEQNYSPAHSININRQMQEELTSQLSQRLGRDDLDQSSQSPGRNSKRMTSKDQRKIIKQLQKQNQDLFKIKIDPKLKQKMIGYEKNQNFIGDYREQNLYVPRNSLHSNSILKQLNYQPNQIQQFLKFHADEEEEDNDNFKIQKQSNRSQLHQLSTGNQSQRERNQSVPLSTQSHQNQQFIPYYRRQSSKGGKHNLQEQNIQHDYQFMLARIDNSQTQTPQTAPSSKSGYQGMGSGRTKLHGFQFVNNKKPSTSIPLPQRKGTTNRSPNQTKMNNQQQLNRERNSSFGTSQTINSEIDGFDKSQHSQENGYDINQYRQDRIKHQSFSLNLMNPFETGQQNFIAVGLNNSRNSTKPVSPLVSRRQTFNCITNLVLDNQQQGLNLNHLQKPPTGRQKPTPKNERSQNSIGRRPSTTNHNGEKKEQIPETIVGNQINLQRKDIKSSSSSRQNGTQNYSNNNNNSNLNNDNSVNGNSIPANNQFLLSGQSKVSRGIYQKQRNKNKDHPIIQYEEQESENHSRYISFDFRSPSFTKIQQ